MQTLNIASDFINFLKPAKTQFHAIQECVRRLEDHHFVRLHEREDWKGKINNGGLYYLTKHLCLLLPLVTSISLETDTLLLLPTQTVHI